MANMKKFLALLFSIVVSYSCTDNQRARALGGTEVVNLKPCEKFHNCTWKGDQLWVVVRDTCKNEFKMREKSSFGLLEGEVIIK